jgi:hypothetical protein
VIPPDMDNPNSQDHIAPVKIVVVGPLQEIPSDAEMQQFTLIIAKLLAASLLEEAGEIDAANRVWE